MNIDLDMTIPLRLYQIEELGYALKNLGKGFDVYTWKTTCIYNWLEKGISKVDALGYFIFPEGLPAEITLPDDVVS